jgi:methionyl-tRNA synthetase
VEQTACSICQREYRDWLNGYIYDHPAFIQFESRRNELLGFLWRSLNDLCISRLMERLSWDIPLTFDVGYVT